VHYAGASYNRFWPDEVASSSRFSISLPLPLSYALLQGFPGDCGHQTDSANTGLIDALQLIYAKVRPRYAPIKTQLEKCLTHRSIPLAGSQAARYLTINVYFIQMHYHHHCWYCPYVAYFTTPHSLLAQTNPIPGFHSIHEPRHRQGFPRIVAIIYLLCSQTSRSCRKGNNWTSSDYHKYDNRAQPKDRRGPVI
jgi:hypothetical protein